MKMTKSKSGSNGFNSQKITGLSVKSEMGSTSAGSKSKITSLSAKKSGMVMAKKSTKPNFSE